MDAPAPRFECYTTTFLRLRDLRFGHECLHGRVNLRVPTRADGESLAPSIQREGLLQALCVWPADAESKDGPFYVLAGGRRLMALHVLRDQGVVDDDLPVSCVIVQGADDAADALAKSLVIEDTHLPPHPVDRFETFAALSARGYSAEQIAERFMVDKRVVRQSLALGDLADEVRAAWRAGELEQAAAQCFTLAENKAQQLKVLERLRKNSSPASGGGGPARSDGGRGSSLDAHSVRKQFSASEVEANRLLLFVGRDAYVAAGGALTEDLFTSSIVVHNFAKLRALAEAKLEAQSARLVADGWSFALVQLRRDYMATAGREGPAAKPKPSEEQKQRLAAIAKRQKANAAITDDAFDEALSAEEEALQEEQLRINAAVDLAAYTPAQKAKLGCILTIDHRGTLVTEPGYKPHPTHPPLEGGSETRSVSGEGTKGARAPTSSEPNVSYDVNRALDQWRSLAAGETLARDEGLALAVLLGHLQCQSAPLGITSEAEHIFVPKTDSFAKILSSLRKQKPATLISLLVRAIGEEVSLDYDHGDEDFLAVLDQAELAKALKRRFDAKLYFAGCSKPHLLAILSEVFGEGAVPHDKSQHDLAALCIKDVTPTAWLPPELRTAAYNPPTLSSPASAAQRREGRGPIPRVSTRGKKTPAKKGARK